MTELHKLAAEKFTSGNEIQVERITITRKEYEAALAQPEQEPVALKMVYGEVCYQSKHDDQSFGMWCPITEREFPNGTPFYTTLPKREWVGLTDDEIEKIVDLNTSDDGGFDIWCDGVAVAHIVCAKLKEKNA